jgi:hypothetical protein
MKTPRFRLIRTAMAALAAIATAAPATVAAQQIVTNWAAYNDHRPGPIIPPHVPTQASWGTRTNATAYDMGAPGNTDNAVLTNFYTGEALPVTMTVTRTGAPDDFPTLTGPGTNTPAGQLFFRAVDLSNLGIVGVDAALDPAGDTVDFVTFTFGGLDPNKRYVFRGTAGRGNVSYTTRWSVATITNVNGFINAHVNGVGADPNSRVLTENDFSPDLGPGQAAWNSGDNSEGAVIGWDFIAPMPDGTFQIVVEQYTNHIAPTLFANSAQYGYSFGAILLAEVETSPVAITENPAATTVVEQNRPFRLTVTATGTPLFYQWYKGGVLIPGATFSSFSVAKAALTNSGAYTVRVYNPLNSVTSTVAQVTVTPDVAGPAIAAAFSFPDFDPTTQAAALNNVTVEFNEPVFGASIGNPANYTLSGGGGNPVSAVHTNERSVLLRFASPLSEDTEYTITVGSAQDELGNTSVAAQRTFRTWVRGPGNALLYEFYEAGPGLNVVDLTSNPVFPNNPSFRTNLWAFDTRVVLPDDAVENFGTRISGIFIPPFTGDWTFFLRAWDRAVVYLNPNGMDPAGKQPILAEDTGNAPRDYQKLRSGAIRLQGGQGYYIEALQKAGAGVDALKLAVLPNAGTNTPPLGLPDIAIDTNAVMGGYIAFPLAPKDLGGTLTISQQPANTTIEANHDATFTVQVNNPSRAPLHYQWFRNGVEIPGANGPSYVFPATAADVGQDFTVRVAKVGSTVTSSAARVSIVPDTTKPRAISVTSSSTNLMEIIVNFDERMTADYMNDPFNFIIVELGGPPQSSLAGADGKSAVLTLGQPLVLGSRYNVQVSNARDLANNTMDTMTLTFTAGGESTAPSLAIALSGGDVVISWPAPSTGFVLEENTSLNGATQWATVAGTPTVVNGQNTMNVTRTGTMKFFRLRQ